MLKVFITGAGDGLGLEFCRQYINNGDEVIATCRTKSSCSIIYEQINNKRLAVYQLDITKQDHISNLKKNINNTPIDIFINNAGVHGPKDETGSFGNINIKEWLKVIKTNAIAPLKVTETFLENISKGLDKKIVFISSRAASIEERGKKEYHKPGGPQSYRSSKAARNSVAKNLTFDLSSLGFSIIVLHPGLVKTKIANYCGHISPTTSVKGMINLIAKWEPSKNGHFYAYDGEVIPW